MTAAAAAEAAHRPFGATTSSSNLDRQLDAVASATNAGRQPDNSSGSDRPSLPSLAEPGVYDCSLLCSPASDCDADMLILPADWSDYACTLCDPARFFESRHLLQEHDRTTHIQLLDLALRGVGESLPS